MIYASDGAGFGERLAEACIDVSSSIKSRSSAVMAHAGLAFSLTPSAGLVAGYRR